MFVPMRSQSSGEASIVIRERLILDIILKIVERYKNLPPNEKELFALIFKKIYDFLIS